MAGSQSDADVESAYPSRRVVLRGVAAGGLGAVAAGLTGCASSGTGGVSATASGAAGASSAAAASGTPGTGAGAGGGAGGGGAGLVAAADVPVGGGIVVGEQKLVVTQPTKGAFKAFSSTCTHQHCQVTSVSDNTIMCPCHGSKFSAEDGSPQNGPATAPLKEVPVKVEAGKVVRA